MRYVLNVDNRLKTPEDMMQKMWNLPTYVPFQGAVTAESAKKFVETLEAAENIAIRSGQKVLPITINSHGGSVYAARGMIDAINNCKIPVATIAESMAMSCGAWLFTCGAEGHRYISPGATIMIHPVSSGVHGKVDDIKVTAKESERLNKLMLREMSVNCGHSENYFEEHLKKAHTNADWFIDGEEAIKYNIANRIGMPTLTINVKMTTDFGVPD